MEEGNSYDLGTDELVHPMSQLQPPLSRPLQSNPSGFGRGLRVIVIASDLPPLSRSGIGVSVASECERLVQLGCKVQILTRPAGASPILGVEVIPLPKSKLPRDVLFDLSHADILHLHSLGMAAFAIETARRWNLPLAYTAHSVIASELPHATAWIAEQNWVLAVADHVFFLNGKERELAVQSDASLRRRSSVRHHGIEPVTFKPVARHLQRVVVAGRLCRNKGTDLAVAALQLAMRRDRQIVATFAADRGDDDCETAFAGLAAEFTDRVQRLGWMPRHGLAQLIASSSLVLCASRYEPFGLLPLESLQFGTPVLAGCAEGAVATLPNVPGAEILGSYDPEVWAQSIRDELSGRILATSLRRDRGCWLRRHFDPLQKVEELADSLAAIHRAKRNLCNEQTQVFRHVA